MSRMFVRSLTGLGIVAAFGILSSTANAAPIVLQDGNSSVTVDPTSQSGISGWVVDGTNQLNQEWFWGSLGSDAPHSLDTSTPTFLFHNGGIMTAKYSTDDGLNITLGLTLTGGSVGSGASVLSETLTIDNTNETPIDLHLYQYADFNLNNTPANDTLSLSGNPVNSADQTDPVGTSVNVAVNAAADHHEIGTDSTLKLALDNGTVPITLNDNGVGPVFGDANFAYEWDPTINAGGSYQLSIVKTIQGSTQAVPVPNSAYGALVLLAVLSGIRVTRKLAKVIA